MERIKSNSKLKYFSIFVVFFASSFLFLQASKISAAELFIGTPNQIKTQVFAQGDEFLANVFLNTTVDSINTVQAKIYFPDALLELKGIRDGNSIINFWVVQPKEAQAGVISFSGVISGGYTGTTGPILSLVFLTKSTGDGTINFDNTAKVLLNDGKGTQASLKTSSLKFSILKGGPVIQSTVEPIKDVEPPEGFIPEVVQNSGMFNEKYFLVFATQDRGSGIDHYEIYETKSKIKNVTNVKWSIAESPYVLQDQRLQSFIYVKAIDSVGNGRIEVVQPRYSIKWYETWWFWFIIIIMGSIVVFYLLKKFLWKKKF